eukprot:139835_1
MYWLSIKLTMLHDISNEYCSSRWPDESSDDLYNCRYRDPFCGINDGNNCGSSQGFNIFVWLWWSYTIACIVFEGGIFIITAKMYPCDFIYCCCFCIRYKCGLQLLKGIKILKKK